VLKDQEGGKEFRSEDRRATEASERARRKGAEMKWKTVEAIPIVLLWFVIVPSLIGFVGVELLPLNWVRTVVSNGIFAVVLLELFT
jgi:hypothetical protein